MSLSQTLAVAVVLKICGLNNKFTDFSLPASPVEINFDHPIPTNEWDPQEFNQLLKANPAAQIIANNVKAEIEQSGTTKWTEKDIKEFVNGPKFQEAMEQANQMEANLRRATEADFGIEPTKKGTNQRPQKQAVPKHQKRR